MDQCYLKPTIKTDPLVWQWCAWLYLIPPLPAACKIVERPLKIMRSYVQNPQIHAQAVKDPKLLGGFFIDLEGKRIDERKTLIEKTKKEYGSFIELHDSFKELDKALQTAAQGDPLESYHARIPSFLKGSVEFMYDLNNYPSVRLIELLIYKKYYSTQHQRIALSDTARDFRKFVLSTPYFDQDDEICLNIPFCDLKLDHLFRMREEPQSLDGIRNLFKIPQPKQQLFQSFFTTTPSSISEDSNYQGDGIQVRYFGHACYLSQTKSVSILFDLVISYLLQVNEVPRYILAKLPLPDHIDYVVITHHHQDCLVFKTLLQLRHKIKHIVFLTNQGGSLEDTTIKLILKYTDFNISYSIERDEHSPSRRRRYKSPSLSRRVF